MNMRTLGKEGFPVRSPYLVRDKDSTKVKKGFPMEKSKAKECWFDNLLLHST